jgi:hypothetical protein
MLSIYVQLEEKKKQTELIKQMNSETLLLNPEVETARSKDHKDIL